MKTVNLTQSLQHRQVSGRSSIWLWNHHYYTVCGFGIATISPDATAAPRSVTSTVVSSTVISVQWDGLDPCRHVNGLIVLYRVQYTEVASGVVQSKDVAGEWNVMNAETSLTGLTPSTSYSIRVAAVNVEDDVGLYSHPLTRQTSRFNDIPLLYFLCAYYPHATPSLINFVVPAQPHVTVGTTTPTSISLSWTSAGSEVDSYEVMWQRDTSGECPDEDEDSISLTDGSTSYDITGLEEDSSYSITVTASNAAGSSSVSNTVTTMTREAGEMISYYRCNNCLSSDYFLSSMCCVLLSAAPSGPPTSVSATSTSTTITVQWRAVDCIHRNGDITGYSVQYGVVGSGSTQTMSVSGGSVTEATISSLMSSTTYSIQVASVNRAGTGVYSDLLFLQTESMVIPDSHMCSAFSHRHVYRQNHLASECPMYTYIATGVYLSLNDDIIPNHGYVVISDIGSTDDTALLCHTNRVGTITDIGGDNNSGGDWFAPNGMTVGFGDISNVPGFRRNRAPMMVRLLRNTATDPPSEGIYHCLIEDDTLTLQTVYVGLYNSGGGIHKNIIAMYSCVHTCAAWFVG